MCGINVTKNHVQHSRTKHIEVRHRFTGDYVEKGGVLNYGEIH